MEEGLECWTKEFVLCFIGSKRQVRCMNRGIIKNLSPVYVRVPWSMTVLIRERKEKRKLSLYSDLWLERGDHCQCHCVIGSSVLLHNSQK